MLEFTDPEKVIFHKDPEINAELRKSFLRFTNLMVERLIENNHKTGWLSEGLEKFLIDKYLEEHDEFLETAVLKDRPFLTGDSRKEGADLANIIMMLTDPERGA